MTKLKDYERIIGKSKIEELYLLAERLSGRVVQTINSTAMGGGVSVMSYGPVGWCKRERPYLGWGIICGRCGNVKPRGRRLP